MKKILVIGDSCFDIFKYGKCNRLSPEAPVPVFEPSYTIANEGMAMNVYNNIIALGAEVEIKTNEINNKPSKVRYVDEISNQMLLRVDMYDDVAYIKNLNEIDFSQYSAVVISDYNKGYLTEENIEYITNNHPLVFLDTKKKIGEWVKGIEVIKINEKEANENSEWLTKHYDGALVVTLGKNGARHWFNEIKLEKESEVRDLSGAGDTFLAGLVVKYLENNDICEAIHFANKCASWVVTQKGVVRVNKEKI